MDCNIKIDKNKNKNYSIYKWKDNLIYANISRYYINQGINPKTKKCDTQLGFISCGLYENINLETTEICIRNHSMKCPFKIKNKNGNNILFNNIDVLFDINNKKDYIIKNNISILDIFPIIKTKDKNADSFLFNEDIKNFFNENNIEFPFGKKKKNLSDKIYIIPNNINNPLLYNKTIINNDNFFQIIYSEGLSIFFISIYLCYICFVKGFIFSIINMLTLIRIFIDFNYNSIMKDFYDKDERFFIVFFCIEFFHSPVFLYYINGLRRLKNKYKEHIWDEIFMKQLKREKYFFIDNLVLYFMQLLIVVIFCFSFLCHYIKNKKKKKNFIEIK
jgi:hypothetical protein